MGWKRILGPSPVVEPLGDRLARQVLGSLGVREPRPDLATLENLYLAWGERLGMENLSKRLLLYRTEDPAEAFVSPEQTFESHLTHGTCGTCWPTMEAFLALARAIGFDARPRLGEMTRPGRSDHGTVVVYLDGSVYSVDQNLLWPRPLPLDREGPTVVDGPHYRAEATYDPRRNAYRIRRYNHEKEFEPTVLLDREVTREDYLPEWERSLRASTFNRGYYIHRKPGGTWRLLNTDTFQEMPRGGPRTVSTPPEDLPRFVERNFGLSAVVVEELLRAEGKR